MKILCVVVVFLSLTSVCQPAPPDCEKLLQPVDNAPDLSGGWYIVAGSTESCSVATIGNSVLWPSLKADITSTDTSDIYDLNFTAEMFGYCISHSEAFLYANNSMFDVDENNAPTTRSAVLVKTSCPDCVVVQDVDDKHINFFLLLSRRKSVTNSELKEFQQQVKCLGWSKMQVFNTDHDYDHCKSDDDDDDDIDGAKIVNLMYQRLQTKYADFFGCLLNTLVSDPHSIIDGIKGLFT